MYVPAQVAKSVEVSARGLRHHVNVWGDPSLVRDDKPPLVLIHGWMDVGASFQFAVDALAQIEGAQRYVIAPDMRGFGLTEGPATDAYWFPDYLGDLEAVMDALVPGKQVDLLGHSMGGNVVMMYAGVRPSRIRKLVNLEGFGLPKSHPADAPGRFAKWLDELKQPQDLRTYPSEAAVAARLQKTNPRLSADKAAWLAQHWARPRDGGYHVLGDPAHKRVHPFLYRVDEMAECFRRISAPLMWVEGSGNDVELWWQGKYTKAEFYERLQVVATVERHTLENAGHMLHHDQPEALAQLVSGFLARP